MLSRCLLAIAAIVGTTYAASKEEWKGRTIYAIMTDRFAPTNYTDQDECTDLNNYCGGTYKGIE